MASWMKTLVLLAPLALAQPPAFAQGASIVADAQAFMEAYGNDLRKGDREAVAAYYDRRGAYFAGNGKKQYRSYDEIHQRYAQSWRPPVSVAWRDMSYEAVGEHAVLVIGLLDWGTPDAGVVTFSYSGLLLRDGQSFKIRLEDESRAK